MNQEKQASHRRSEGEEGAKSRAPVRGRERVGPSQHIDEAGGCDNQHRHSRRVSRSIAERVWNGVGIAPKKKRKIRSRKNRWFSEDKKGRTKFISQESSCEAVAFTDPKKNIVRAGCFTKRLKIDSTGERGGGKDS